MMQAPEVVYGDPSMMDGVGSQARLYQAGAKGAAAGGRGNAADKGNVGGDDMGGGAQLHAAGHYVQVMDPEGKVYYLPQGQQ